MSMPTLEEVVDHAAYWPSVQAIVVTSLLVVMFAFAFGRRTGSYVQARRLAGLLVPVAVLAFAPAFAVAAGVYAGVALVAVAVLMTFSLVR
jgi:hypothetical protein